MPVLEALGVLLLEALGVPVLEALVVALLKALGVLLLEALVVALLEALGMVEVVLAVVLHGYTTSDHPIVGGPGPCPHCFCSPCILSNPPSFLVGSSAADIRNANKRFILYGNFWRLLKDIGLWNYEPYLVRKSARTLRADVREIIPSCVTNVSGKYNVTIQQSECE